jgi:protein SCO1
MKSVFVVAVLTLALTAGCSSNKPLHGTGFSPAQPEPRFRLTDQSGSPYVVAQQSKSFTALYFGFTHCKDVCPQTLQKLEKARDRAGLRPEQLEIVMITIDPARDTASAMRKFFSAIGVRAVGLTGTKAQLRKAYRAYGVAVAPEKNDIGHSDYIYVLDRDGRLRELLSSQMPINDIAEDLRTLVE